MATPARATRKAKLGIGQLGTTRLGASFPTQTASPSGTTQVTASTAITTAYTRVAAP